MNDKYMIGFWIVGSISALIIWIYSFVSWGFLIGLMLGWIPALIGGVLFGFIWPLVVLAIGALVVLLISSS